MASAEELAQHLYDFLLPHIDEAALANQPRDRVPSVFTSQSLQTAASPPQQPLLRPSYALPPPRPLLHPPQAPEALQHPPHAVHYPPHVALPPPPLASHLSPPLYSWAGSSLFPSDSDFLPPPLARHPSPSYPSQSDLPLCSSGPIAQSLPPPISKPARPLLSRSSRASVHQDLLMDMESAFERSNDSINPKQCASIPSEHP
ncbi:hypothetical protein AB1Y20_004925 [Prymnesium parvum]|uniref:Uncharacterized protein n=1 Tax=Prymnesium parvum TaxID=97485 RepID=A0AB34IY41_PRYPA